MFNQFAGYMAVDVIQQRKLFYYFVEATKEPASKPVFVLTSLPGYALSFFKAPSEEGCGIGCPSLVTARRLKTRGRRGSQWWREVSKIRDGEYGDGGGWFSESVVRQVGNGVDTFFWTDPWLDHWLWRHDTSGGYSVQSAYKLLTSLVPPEVDAMSNFLWHKQVPVKVSVLAWRLLRNRLSTKDNLVARHIIPSMLSFV
ncbi:hypothetical protein TSUD_373400 [Trifolium subterraneum]|uniref:Reverse transcriptase zinc-binding domain-containing protein n=1 Tax=Trifolium subterraneum TaxID=3900 RepID=A0A2Z6NXH6_TRISU|nr:hypothetical protein TSUD_373400 [Trifolium subterraneum]